MRSSLRKCWPLAKILFTAAILFFIGRNFLRDLSHDITGDLWKRHLGFGWLLISGILYLLGLGFSLLFWYRLLKRLGQRPTIESAVRAYYIGHMGKYLPGKAWALMLRAMMVRSDGVRLGVAVLTSFYEVLTTMASGALLGAALYFFLAPDLTAYPAWTTFKSLLMLQDPGPLVQDRKLLTAFSLALLAVVGAPVLPFVFNRIVRRVALPFQKKDNFKQPPAIDWRALGEGLVLTGFGWLLLGASLWAVLQALEPTMPEFQWLPVAGYSAALAVAYVAGFVIILVPSGLGVREFFLKILLVQQLAGQWDMPETETRALAVLAVLLLRITWTAAEIIIVSILYWLPGPALATIKASPDLDDGGKGT
jgi:hypothetical protein